MSPEMTIPTLKALEDQWRREDADEVTNVAAGDTTSTVEMPLPEGEERSDEALACPAIEDGEGGLGGETSPPRNGTDSFRSAFHPLKAKQNATQVGAGNGSARSWPWIPFAGIVPPEVEILPDGSRRLKGVEDPFRFDSPKGNETQNATHSALNVQTAPEIAAQEDYEVSWVWDGFLARGTTTLVAGVPKVGKSTLYFDLIEAMECGEPFLDRATTKTGALILSEEPGITLRDKAEGLPDTVHVLLWEKNHQIPYSILIRKAVEYCLENGLGLLVIDSFARWSRVEESDPQEMLAALKPLQEAADAGLAVLIVHHHRKAAGTDGERMRGSNALTGAVATFIDLERRKGVSKNARYVSTNSWFAEPPEEFVYERDPEDGYRVLDPSEAKLARAKKGKAAANVEAERKQLLAALSESPGSTKQELGQILVWPSSRIYTRLNALQDEGKVRHEGAGGKGDPHRWSLIEEEELAA
jgi:AAA domain